MYAALATLQNARITPESGELLDCCKRVVGTEGHMEPAEHGLGLGRMPNLGDVIGGMLICILL